MSCTLAVYRRVAGVSCRANLVAKRILSVVLLFAAALISSSNFVHASPSLGLDGVGVRPTPCCGSQPNSELLSTNNGNDVIIVIIECGYTSCNANVSSVSDSYGLSYTQRASYSPNSRLWEYYAVAPTPLQSDNITVLSTSPYLGPGIVFAVKGTNTATIFDPDPSLPASTSCGSFGRNDCTISAGTSNLDFVIASTAINDAGSCGTSAGFSEVTPAGGSLDVDYRIVDASQSGISFTCSGTDPTAIILDALVSSDHQPHAPILINGNGAFTVDNGVTGGSGTSSDPYTIQGWDIDGSNGNGIEIRNTDAYFVITDLYIHSETSPASYSGVNLYNVTNGSLEESRIVGFLIGVGVQGGNSLTITRISVEWNSQAILLRGPANIEIANNDLSNNGAGINAGYLSSADVSSNTFRNDGILVYRSLNFVMAGNTIQGDHQDGISIDQSNSFQVIGNRLSGDGGRGIAITNSLSFSVTDNSVKARTWGNGLVGIDVSSYPLGSSQSFEISNNYIYGNSVGISMNQVFDSNVSNNTLLANRNGAVLTGSSNVTFLTNAFDYNTQGLILNSTQNMLVYHNNFYGDTPLAVDLQGSNNFWDNGYLDGGNFWTDFKGVDNCSGPNQDICTGPDGIGDTPYTFNYNQDNYPLMNPIQVLSNNPQGPDWTNARGTWTVVNGYMDATGVSPQIQSGASFPSDRTVSVRAMTITSGETVYKVAYLYGKYVDFYDKLYMYIQTDGTIILAMWQGTTNHSYVYYNSGLSPYSWHTFKMVISGNTAWAYIDGTLYITATDSIIGSLGAASVGLASWGPSESQFDSVMIS